MSSFHSPSVLSRCFSQVFILLNSRLVGVGVAYVHKHCSGRLSSPLPSVGSAIRSLDRGGGGQGWRRGGRIGVR